MELNNLLELEGFDPKTVLVLRHTPTNPKLRRRLGWLAANQPDVYNAYQSTQKPKIEKAFKKASHVASFIGHEAGKALFIGLYRRRDWRTRRPKEIPAYVELNTTYGQSKQGWEMESVVWFDLELLPDFYADWKGKLIVEWPGAKIAWWRWAARNTMPVQAILVESALDPEMDPWEELVLTWDDLQFLPPKWEAALEQWPGIYLIFDESNGKSYVGSACGNENILGRWRNYRDTGHGGNKELRHREPTNFQFSILQPVSIAMTREDVNSLETTWKKRLHTYAPFGMNEN